MFTVLKVFLSVNNDRHNWNCCIIGTDCIIFLSLPFAFPFPSLVPLLLTLSLPPPQASKKRAAQKAPSTGIDIGDRATATTASKAADTPNGTSGNSITFFNVCTHVDVLSRSDTPEMKTPL